MHKRSEYQDHQQKQGGWPKYCSYMLNRAAEGWRWVRLPILAQYAVRTISNDYTSLAASSSRGKTAVRRAEGGMWSIRRSPSTVSDPEIARRTLLPTTSSQFHIQYDQPAQPALLNFCARALWPIDGPLHPSLSAGIQRPGGHYRCPSPLQIRGKPCVSVMKIVTDS